MVQLMPLPLTVSCFSKIQIGFTLPVPAHLGSPGQRAVKWLCVSRKRLRDLCARRCSLLSNYSNLVIKKSKGSTYSITERRVLELIPVLGSQPAGDVSHKPSSRLPFTSTRPAVTPATLKRAATSFAAW